MDEGMTVGIPVTEDSAAEDAIERILAAKTENVEAAVSTSSGAQHNACCRVEWVCKSHVPSVLARREKEDRMEAWRISLPHFGATC